MDINTDRICENCGADWRGSQYCPICGHLDNLGGMVTACAWCPTHAAILEDAHAQGLEVTSGLCEACAAREWTEATEAYRSRLAVERRGPNRPRALWGLA